MEHRILTTASKCRFWVSASIRSGDGLRTVRTRCDCGGLPFDRHRFGLSQRAGRGPGDQRSGVPREELSLRRSSGCRTPGTRARSGLSPSRSNACSSIISTLPDPSAVRRRLRFVAGDGGALPRRAVRAIGVATPAGPAGGPDPSQWWCPPSIRSRHPSASRPKRRGDGLRGRADRIVGAVRRGRCNNLFGNGTLVTAGREIPESVARSSCAG